jgi:hypothetical protein
MLQWLCLGEKLGGGPKDGSADVMRIVSGALFLGSSRVHRIPLGQCERLPCKGTFLGKCTGGIRGQAQEAYVACVSVFP